MGKKITVIGIGPGSYDMLTIRASKALEKSSVIVGYHVYVDLLREHYPDKRMLTTPMRKEEERCEMALKEADAGENVAFVCSGDSGIYGMAGLIYEMAVNYPDVEIEVIPGITAASSGAAVLGAPLIHDTALISLSDLMTPWEKIEMRLKNAAAAGFVIVLYNPSSKKRSDYLEKACDIILSVLSSDTVCGTVSNIGREGEEMRLYSLGELRQTKVDMFTTVFIGNSSTKVVGGRMVTPRGYALERE